MWNHPSVQSMQSDETCLISEPRLKDSYQRCEDIGIERKLSIASDVLQGEKLSPFLEKHHRLACNANSLFFDTFRHLQDQKALFILTDGVGRIITLSSKPEVLALAATHGIVVGASLSEASLGTNAVSLALHHAEPVVIRGQQHFCKIFADWYCVAIPIIVTDGKPVACLDISTCHEETLGDKLALANLLATKIRNFLQNNQLESDDINIPVVSASQISTLTARQQQVLVLFS